MVLGIVPLCVGVSVGVIPQVAYVQKRLNQNPRRFSWVHSNVILMS